MAILSLLILPLTISCASREEQSLWAPQEPSCCSQEQCLGYPSVPRDLQRDSALSPALCFWG